MLLLIALFVWTTSAFTLTCHCLNGSSCHANGFCVQGCEKGWYGPGCQVGNVALGKPAQQSSTLDPNGDFGSADRAVDGSEQSNVSNFMCTHTRTGYQNAWWTVTLDTMHNYDITNVTLVNRIGSTSIRLSNFVILYSNETDSIPNLTDGNWREFAREEGTVGHNKTYAYNNTVTAKRVAVYLRAFPDNIDAILTLCEVLIYGYHHYECPHGFTGPGCLLRACDQCVSTGGRCTGNFDSCSYDVCPDDSLLPPDCWITLSNFTELGILSAASCNSVLFFVVLPDSQQNIAATSLKLEVTTSSDPLVLQNTTLSLLTSTAVYYKFSTASADTSYNASVKLQYCDSTGRSCFHTTRSKVFPVLTGKRDYIFSHNYSCIFISVSSGTPGCKLPSTIQMTCQSEGNDKITVNSSTSTVCGLEKDQGYNCSFAATIDGHTTERQSAYIVMGRLSSPASSENECSAVAGSISGSVAAVVVLATITAFVFYRRQRNAQSHGSTVMQDVSAHSHCSAPALQETSLPASNQEKFDNPYEALQKASGLETGEDYATLKSST